MFDLSRNNPTELLRALDDPHLPKAQLYHLSGFFVPSRRFRSFQSGTIGAVPPGRPQRVVFLHAFCCAMEPNLR